MNNTDKLTATATTVVNGIMVSLQIERIHQTRDRPGELEPLELISHQLVSFGMGDGDGVAHDMDGWISEIGVTETGQQMTAGKDMATICV
ncbi:uncharacterized protein ACHE_50661S [Aspergillus chevalieri]|uniref:Uncharacterized protein n=1 Tax=Aspergillus chevalieri TaxID=182096 RepID=A0A7R7ZPC4_ASPCH|nr:uncharacterized protein ACHE_50661S [Aspergillus chevalieri]BCR89463.1 hypothetical protein ACHE_50661S [Aspergillus chevalieri]